MSDPVRVSSQLEMDVGGTVFLYSNGVVNIKYSAKYTNIPIKQFSKCMKTFCGMSQALDEFYYNSVIDRLDDEPEDYNEAVT